MSEYKSGLPGAPGADPINDEPEDEIDLQEEQGGRKKKKRKKIVILAAAVVLLGGGGFIAVNALGAGTGGTAAGTGSSYTEYTVDVRDISLTLSGTGALQPANSYTVTTLISGEILSAPFEEGDVVEKDAMLYQVDSSEPAKSIEQAENSLAQSRRSYEQKVKSLDDLSIQATVGGTVLTLDVEAGDKVSAGQTIATIRDSATMKLTIPFAADDAVGFCVGQSAEVTLDGSFERLTGTVTKVSAVDERLDGNMLVRQVTVEVPNPGGIAADQAATAMVGGAACNSSGTFAYKDQATVTAAASGEVSAVYAGEGDRVSKDQLLVTLKSDTLTNDILNSAGSLRDAELSLESRYDQLDNYTIQSPIAGQVIEKNYKAGDTLESGKTLCTIFDLSYLTMTLNVDELDIANVAVGQEVTVTAEALTGKTYRGAVTKVNINGTTSGGTTSYPVTIRIDETDGLLPGMNVQASIVVADSKGTAAIPVSALSRGNRVLVKSGGAAGQSQAAAGIPDGFQYVEVTPGISDGDYIAITGGLSAGDIIAVPEAAAAQSQGQTQGNTMMIGGVQPQGGGNFNGGTQGGGNFNGGTQGGGNYSGGGRPQ